MPRISVHPGKILAEQLAALSVSPTELSRQIRVPPNRISQIIHGKRSITGDTALRFAHWFKTTPEYWLNLQTSYDVSLATATCGSEIERLPTKAGAGRPAQRAAKLRKSLRAG